MGGDVLHSLPHQPDAAPVPEALQVLLSSTCGHGLASSTAKRVDSTPPPALRGAAPAPAPGPTARPAPLGDSDRVRVGQQVPVISAPYGLSHSFSAGWISAKWLARSG